MTLTLSQLLRNSVILQNEVFKCLHYLKPGMEIIICNTTNVHGAFPEKAFLPSKGISLFILCNDICVISTFVSVSLCLPFCSYGDCAATLRPRHWEASKLRSQHGESLHRLDLCRWTHHGWQLPGMLIQFKTEIKFIHKIYSWWFKRMDSTMCFRVNIHLHVSVLPSPTQTQTQACSFFLW